MVVGVSTLLMRPSRLIRAAIVVQVKRAKDVPEMRQTVNSWKPRRRFYASSATSTNCEGIDCQGTLATMLTSAFREHPASGPTLSIGSQQPVTYLRACLFSLMVSLRFGQPVLFEPMISSVSSPLAPLNRPIPPTTAIGPDSG